jgi:hypothetical protein
MNTTDKFDRIIDLDRAVRVMHASVTFAAPKDLDRKMTSLAADKARLFAALDTLTPEEFQAFLIYRREVLAS